MTFCKNYKYRYAPDLKALFVCERDKNGNYHFHGLLASIPDSDLGLNEHGYLDWLPFVKRFGFCSMSKVRNREACAKYITKYLTKDFGDNVPKGRHLYFRFGDLKQSIEVFRLENLDMGDFVPDYAKDRFCKVWNLHSDDLDNFFNSLKEAPQ